ncbi:CpaF family protein [Kutzneria buriramensis]|uniref:Flp pilus assembly CpaF family ATPase n=1 Tax=Kutzneria buriramensis TaxID=1045776 RepID=A0A3E0GWC3_9PSEU|nr:CpaF/VirB11 family protein [Kutzneria buriramensis]REH28636.1 Flp pilus assembly CpaF family ATPase [Kutzneria buriramensis]
MTAIAVRATRPGADPRLVAELRRRVDVRLEQATSPQGLSHAEDAARTEAAVWQEIETWTRQRATSGLPALTRAEEQELAAAVMAALSGLGPLEVLLRRTDVENIFVFGCDSVFLELADGTTQPWPYSLAESDAGLVALLEGMFARLGATSREFSVATPVGNVRLPAGGPLGARLAAVMQVTERPTAAIRLHRLVNATLDTLIGNGTVDTVLAGFLSAAVRAGLRIVVSGEWGSGKTTLLRALCHEILPFEHVVTIEDERELGLHTWPARHPLVTSMEARLPNAEGVGGITVEQLLVQALRHSPRRVIVGEVRGGEVTTLLRALSTGAGGLCTLHADTAAGVFDRIANMAQLATPPLPVDTAYRWTATAVDLIVHVRRRDRVDQGRPLRERFVSQVLEVGAVGDSGRPDAATLLGPDPDTGHARAMFPPSPQIQERLRAHGLDMSSWAEA